MNILSHLTFQNDENKSYDLASKLCQLQLNALDLEAAVNTLNSQLEHVKDQHLQRSLHEKIVKICSQQTSVPADLCDVYKNCLLALIHDNATIENMENRKHLIKLTHEVTESFLCSNR